MDNDKHIVVIGAGFAGLQAVLTLADESGVRVTWVDRHNYHLFLPLLYQVATASVEAPDIATPARDVLRKYRNVRFVLGTADRIDLTTRRVVVDGAELEYDALIVATGSKTAELGVAGVKEHGHTLKDLSEALLIRERIVSACEEAAQTADADRVRSLLSFTIVGGGPTGVEMAGALAEYRLHVMPRVYPEIDPELCRILLVDSSERPLSMMSKHASSYARGRLEEYGVELLLETRIGKVTQHGVVTDDGREIDSFTVIWAAGVQGVVIEGLPEPGQGSRIETDDTLALHSQPEVFIAGDLNGMIERDTDGPLPQVAAVATQQGVTAAHNALAQVRGTKPERFRYRNYGSMVTVGRHRAVMERGVLKVTGFPAWIAWLAVHLVKLVGGRNRLMVLLSWLHMYFTRDFAVRVLTRRHVFPRRPDARTATNDEHPSPDVPAEGPDPDEAPPGELFARAQESDGEAGQPD